MNNGSKFSQYPYLQKIINSEFKHTNNYSPKKHSAMNSNTNNSSISSNKVSFIKLLTQLDKKENLHKANLKVNQTDKKNNICKLKSKRKIQNGYTFLTLFQNHCQCNFKNKLKDNKNSVSNSENKEEENQNSNQSIKKKNNFEQDYQNKMIIYRNLKTTKLPYQNSSSNNSNSEIMFNANNHHYDNSSLTNNNEENKNLIKLLKDNNNSSKNINKINSLNNNNNNINNNINNNKKIKPKIEKKNQLIKDKNLYCSTEPDKLIIREKSQNSIKKNKIIKPLKVKNKENQKINNIPVQKKILNLFRRGNQEQNDYDINIIKSVDFRIKEIEKKENLSTERKDIIPNFYERKFSDENTGETIYENKNKNNITYSEISVADENISNIIPKTMRYTKQIYSNNYISNHLRNLFFLQQEKNFLLFSFLTIQDIFNLSFVNHFFLSLTLDILYFKIQKNFSSENKDYYINKLWEQLYKSSKINFEEINLLNNNNSIYKEEILKDLTRTFPDDPLFKKNSDYSIKLFNILVKYSIYNNKIGYAQGINYIVATLLKKFNNEKDVFIYFDIIMKKLNFEKIVGVNNNLLEKLNLIKELIENNFPLFNNFLVNNKINHEFFTLNWIITLFSKDFRKDNILFEIWDYIIIFGWKFIYLFIIALIQHFQNKLIQLDLFYFTKYMKDIFKTDDFLNNYDKIIKYTFELMSHNYIFDNTNWRLIEGENKEFLENNLSDSAVILDSDN